MMYGFFPLTEIIAFTYLVKKKFKDLLVALLLALDMFFLIFAVAGFPVALAKITLLSNTTVRIIPIICLIEIFVFLRILSVTDNPLVQKKWLRIVLVSAGVGISVIAVYSAAHSY